MSKSTTEPTMVQMSVTPAQLALLEFISHAEARNIAISIGNVNLASLQCDCPDVEAIEQLMVLTRLCYNIALESKETKVE